ncbi:MAG: 30S ribosomal protein S21 [Alphaproteobacteria bacterium]|nr:30S ribosomal protein S21 [Alphaproteobacteria bacterium]
MVKVFVSDDKAEQALRVFKRRVMQEGILKAFKMHQSYEKPSEKRVRERAESVKRLRKLNSKRFGRDD